MKRKKEKWVEFIEYIDDIKALRSDVRYEKIVKVSKDSKCVSICNINKIKGDFELYSISKCCRNIDGNNCYKGYYWFYLEEYRGKVENKKSINNKHKSKSETSLNISKKLCEKKIKQYELDGRFIRMWNSANEIATYYKTTAKAIRKVCNKERKSCYGFIWEYVENNEWYYDQTKKSKQVLQFDLSENLIRVWPNIKEASEFYYVTVQSIQRACNGKMKTCKNFIWKHYDSTS